MSVDHEQILTSSARSAKTKHRNSRRSIVSAAALSFYTNGYQDSNITKIGDSANSAATLYNHFKTKASVGLAVIEATFPEIIKLQQNNKMTVSDVARSLGITLFLYDAIGLALFEERARTCLTTAELLPEVFEKMSETVTTGQSFDQIRLDPTAARIADMVITQTTAMSIGQPQNQAKGYDQLSILINSVHP